MKQIVPYIYKITFIPDGKVYIGCRFNKSGCHPDEFWVKYFTSSKYVKKLIEEYGTGLDVWEIEIIKVFDYPIELREVPNIENQYIIEHVNRLGKEKILNRKWVLDGKPVYSNAGMTYKCQSISEKSKGMVLAKDVDGNIVKVTQEEFKSRADLVGVGLNMKFYYNPETNHRIKISVDETPPEGYVPGLGRTHSDESKIKSADRQRGKFCINNGTENKQWIKGEPIPEGWVEGRIKYTVPGWTDERRAKREATMKKKRAERLAKQAMSKPPKHERVYTPHSEERKMKNRETQRRVAEERRKNGIPHKNTGRKRSEEEIKKQKETYFKNRILEGF